MLGEERHVKETTDPLWNLSRVRYVMLHDVMLSYVSLSYVML